MKILSILLLLNISLMAQTTSFDKLYKLYSEKKYFKFISQLKESQNTLSENEKNICNVFYFGLMNNRTESEKYFKPELISDSSIPDSAKKDLYSTSILNNVWLGNYKKAGEETEIVLKNYSSLIKSKDKEDYENSLIIWKSLAGLGRQEVVKKSDVKIKMKKDIAGLYNIPARYNDTTIDFVFDSGANFSTITETQAKNFNITLTSGRIKVGTITEKKVDAVIGYSNSFFMGDMEIKNTVFLVVPDEVLSFAGGMYKINGIIGFPVMEAMGEVSFSKNGEFIVTLNISESNLKNLVVDGFNPVIEVDYKKNPLAFTFDTGAKTTLLYAPFLEEYKNEITSQYKLEDVKFEGAGGETIVPGYHLTQVEFSVANDKTVIPKVSLLSQPIKNNGEFFYGNLGQDFISKFNFMTLNFKKMFVDFK